MSKQEQDIHQQIKSIDQTRMILILIYSFSSSEQCRKSKTRLEQTKLPSAVASLDSALVNSEVFWFFFVDYFVTLCLDM